MRWLVMAMVLVPGLLAPVLARADARWDQWQVILWQERTAEQVRGLAALGFTGVKLRATGGEVDPAARARFVASGLPYYLENIATDLYAPYHRSVPDKTVTWLFDLAKSRYRAGDPAAYVREPSLSDPAWLERVRGRLDRLVRAEAPNRPLFYNLGDETGIGDLAAAWDFDMGPESLAGFRAWLPTQYPDIEALNRQWGASFARWDDVMPDRTDDAVWRTDGNFSAWSDFKEWMDVAFTRALRAGTDAVHAADKGALAAIEGGQVPGWGGYDYRLLAGAVDVMEIYDVGQSLDLAMAFNPGLIPLRTSFGTGPGEAHATWRSLLHGGRGMIVWDERDDVVRADGSPGPRGREIGALTEAIRAVAPLLRDTAPDPDPVAILYNQTSFRVRWLLDRQGGDRDWAARDAEREYDDNAWRGGRRAMVQRLAEAGVQPRFVSGPMLEGLFAAGVRLLLLPHAIALSEDELAGIRAFRAAGGTVLADTEPGLFDGHGRRRSIPPLPDVPHPAALRPDGDGTNPAMLGEVVTLLEAAGVVPRVTLLGPDGQRATGVEARWFKHAAGPILALQAGRPWGAPGRVTVVLAGRAERREVVLDPVAPTVLGRGF